MGFLVRKPFDIFRPAILAIAMTYIRLASYHNGIGGGGFALVHAPNGTTDFIDFRETAPMAIDNMAYIRNPNASKFGGSARCEKLPYSTLLSLTP